MTMGRGLWTPVAVALVGGAALVLPALYWHGADEEVSGTYMGWLFAWVQDLWEPRRLSVLVTSVAVASILSATFSRLRPWQIGGSVATPFIVLSIIEAMIDKSTHHLIGIEWVIYGCVAGVSGLSAAATRAISGLFPRAHRSTTL